MKCSIMCTLSSWPRHRRKVCSLSMIGLGIVFNWNLNEFRKACCTAVMGCFLVSRELYAELLKPSPNVSISFFITFSRISSCCFNKSVLFNSSPAKFYLFNSFKSKIYLNQEDFVLFPNLQYLKWARLFIEILACIQYHIQRFGFRELAIEFYFTISLLCLVLLPVSLLCIAVAVNLHLSFLHWCWRAQQLTEIWRM